MQPLTEGKLALATATFVIDDDEDMPPLLEAARACEVDSTVVPWDDPDVDWSAFDLVVLRSTWDYVHRYDEFLTWLRRVDAVTRLRNPIAVVEWSTDKRYLTDLDQAGVPVVPTAFVDSVAGATALVLETGEHVVKPTISAGARDTARHSTHGSAREHAAAIVETGHTAMVQPYVDSVDARGETSCVFFDGVLSHAFTKGPILTKDTPPTADRLAGEVIEPREPSGAELRVAAAALAAVPAPTLYARVDLVTLADGSPAVLELELVEPSFYLWTDPLAAKRFVLAAASDLVRARADTRRSG